MSLLSLDLDVATVKKIITGFTVDYVRRSGAKGCVVGLSGGLDSAVVARLLVAALGKERVSGLTLPHRESDPLDVELAEETARGLGVALEVVDVTGVVEALTHACEHRPTPAAFMNLKARARMVVLYAHANSAGQLVAGTGNKSELLTGYFTKYGDGGVDLQPIGDLYKTQVRRLAEHLGVPKRVRDRVPTAGLAPGQTDEGELGLTYDELDRILLGIELELPRDAILERVPTTPEKLARVEGLMKASWHKRSAPLIPKLGHRTVGLDWRNPVT